MMNLMMFVILSLTSRNSATNLKYLVLELSKMHILITGGAGFIGSQLAEHHLKKKTRCMY